MDSTLSINSFIAIVKKRHPDSTVEDAYQSTAVVGFIAT